MELQLQVNYKKYIPKKNVLNHPCVFDLSHDAKYRNQYFCQTE